MTQTQASTAWITLAADLVAQVDPLGAQLSSLQDRSGRDLLWDGDPRFWSGRAPLLFPIVGELAGGHYHLGGKSYPLSRHGFARRKPFRVLQTDGASATFRLQEDADTLRIYPFEFDLDIAYVAAGAALTVTAQIRNRGNVELPASFGFHPALRWPLPYSQPRSAHFIEFETTEPAAIRRLNAEGLVEPRGRPTPVAGRRLALTDGLFVDDALILDQLRSRFVTYGAAAGPRIRVSFPTTPYLGFWSKPGAGFVCIEPWHGIADPIGYSGEFRDKPGVFLLPPGGVQSVQMVIELLKSA